MKLEIKNKNDVQDLEEGTAFAPCFDKDGLIPTIVTDHQSAEVLMFAYMNKQSLQKTLETGQAVYWSRRRKALWHKGAVSGHVQEIKELRVDCDQDCLWLKVEQKGAACHVGYRSCFFRAWKKEEKQFSFSREEKVFDPKEVYK